VSGQFPDFRLSCAMRQPAARRFVVLLSRELQQPQVDVDRSASLHLESTSLVEKLTKNLHAANRLVQLSLSAQGNPGQILVRRMRFPSNDLAVALQPSDGPVPELRPRADPPTCVGDVLLVGAGLLDESANHVLHGAQPAHPDGFALHLGLHSGHFHVAVSHEGPLPNGRVPRDHFRMITLDIAACTSAVTLHFRGVDVMVNGPWQTCRTGLLAMTAGMSTAIAALSSGVPCVVYARAGHQSNQRLSGLAQSLHLDNVRR